MSKSGIPPRQILTSLWQANPDLKATSRTVYNTKAKIRDEELGGRTPIQALLEELSIGGFAHNIQLDGDGRFTHLFFAHPLSIKLSRSYSNIFVMDCTYKTNKFKMPLLDIIGVSSFNNSLYSCFAFLSKEEESDYAWALTMFKKMLGINELTVIVSDRELALMNAIEIVFLRATNLLCVWHIEKNILANCKQHFEEEEDWETFSNRWIEVVESDSESSFNETWIALENSYKEKVTSRAESAHAVLKRYLQVSTSNLQMAAEKICLAVENNFHEIRVRLASEKLKKPHNICAPFFRELVHGVSIFALEKLYKQSKLASSNSPLSACKGHFTATMGLPCAHAMRNMRDGILPLSYIHSQWRIDTRSFEDDSAEPSNGNDKLKIMFQELQNKYQQWPITQKEVAENQVSQLINSSMPIVFDPVVQPHKGHPSGSKNIISSTI